MTKWLIVLLAVAVLVWRLTKPRASVAEGGGDDKARLVRCEKCGVHHQPGEPCDCKRA